eukprot:Lithocolla_globosa_v1_NODE_3148_length_1750_cov_81.515044.p1 type:complete len:151 gc:universal NODE_3148_length_1750_cov_81.515044:918-1370(+)
MENLSEDTLGSWKEAFHVFLKDDSDGRITGQDSRSLIRVLGLTPTDKELAEMEASADPDGDGLVEFPDFVNMFVKNFKKVEKKYDPVFKSLESGDGIDIKEFKHMMTTIGEKMTMEEINEIMEQAGLTGGKAKADDFLKAFTTPLPELPV